MLAILSKAKYTTITALFLALFVLNAALWQQTFLGVILLAILLVYYGGALSARLAPGESQIGQTIFGSAGILALLAILGSIAYYFDALTVINTTVIVIVIPLIVWFFQPWKISPKLLNDREPKHKTPKTVLAAVVSVLILFIGLFSMLLNTQVTEAVRSPWLVVPAAFFIGVFLIALLITGLAMRGTERALSLPLIILFFFLMISVAMIIFPLGYGFDTFIHQATENHIALYGTITPKPFYYIGQYALVVITSQAFFLPIEIVDKLLLPVLASIFVPLSAFVGFRHLTGVVGHSLKDTVKEMAGFAANNSRSAVMATISIFLIPLSSFIVTTPQGLANMWSLIILFGSIPILLGSRRFLNYGTLVLFATAAILTHPLAGIPIAFYLALLGAGPMSRGRGVNRVSKYAFWSFVVIGSFILPILFFVNAQMNGLDLAFSLGNIFNIDFFDLLHLNLFFENRFHTFKDAAYLIGWNLVLIIFILTGIGLTIIKKQKLPKSLYVPFILAVMMLVNYLVMSTVVDFTFLIDYERSNYADRIFTMMLFFLTPYIAVSVARAHQILAKKPYSLRLGFIVLSAIVLTAMVYLTYPRHDNYEISRGFNVSDTDFKTVRYIDQTAKDTEFIVLANQAVSAAAVKEYGFKKYYNNVFYYPIPTGGPLYNIYLDMVNLGPTQDRALKAMDLTGVNTAYFVVNNYWFQAEKIIENAKREANDWISIDAGTAYVFVFRR